MKKYVNGSIPTPVVLSTPAAQRSEAEQSEADPSAAAGVERTKPDPEVAVRAQRRQYTAEYKKRILAEADASRGQRAIGAMLRREGLYSSHLTNWRKQRDQGLTPQQRGPKPKHDPLFEQVRQLQIQNNRLTQRLAHAELIIDVQKKVSLLLGIPLAAADSNGSNS
jgi:transposase